MPLSPADVREKLVLRIKSIFPRNKGKDEIYQLWQSLTVPVWSSNAILYKTLYELLKFVNLSKFREIVTEREVWHVAACGVAMSRT